MDFNTEILKYDLIADCANISDAFIVCCQHQNFDIRDWLMNSWPHEFDTTTKNDIFVKFCQEGQLETAQWLINIWPELNIHYEYDRAFRLACHNGHLNVARWLKTTWNDINHHDDNNSAFLIACGNGKLDVVTWLASLDTNYNYNYGNALYDSIRYNHWQVIDWLLTEIHHDAIDISIIQNTFDRSCLRKIHTTAQLIHDKWHNVDVRAASYCYDEWFRFSLRRGDIDTARWIVSIWPILKHGDYRTQFEFACEQNNNPVIKYLTDFSISNNIENLINQIFNNKNTDDETRDVFIENIMTKLDVSLIELSEKSRHHIDTSLARIRNPVKSATKL